jgi:hypothetical protein
VATGLLIGLATLAALTCPAMMLLGRRGIGPGCVTGCGRGDNRVSLEDLRAQHTELSRRIAVLEAARAAGERAAPAHWTAPFSRLS